MKNTEVAPAVVGHNASPDLRSWLQRLAATGRLAVARNGISLIDELAAVSKKLELERAVMFPRPGGHAMAVVSNLFVDRSWVADSIGVPTEDLLARFQQAVRQPLPWIEVKDAAAQEVVHRDVDLLKLLPIPKHNEHDSGPYITAALLIARNPKTGVQNVSIHRCQVSGPDRIGVLLLPRHTHHYFRMAEEAGEALEIALVIGVHPACILASQAIAALDEDEMEIAGALMGAPVEMVKCKTNRVRVPAHAEIVIEGRILPKIREAEGPFGEFPQYYGPRANREVIHVDAVTHRANAIFHTIVGGGMEHLLLGEIPREATLVDLDVDIDDPHEIEWAVATRFQADRDLLVVSGAQGSKLDPSSQEGISAKMGIDATKPVEAEVMKFKRIHVKGLEDVDLASVLQSDSNVAFARTIAGSTGPT